MKIAPRGDAEAVTGYKATKNRVMARFPVPCGILSWWAEGTHIARKLRIL